MSGSEFRREEISPLSNPFGRSRRHRDASAEQVIAAAPAQVWALVTDIDRIGQWWPRAVGGEIVEGQEIGRQQLVRLDWGRREGRIRQKVTQWEPNVRYGWRVVAESIDDKVLKPIADIRVTLEIQSEGPLSRVKLYGEFEPIASRGALALRQISRLARATYKQALSNVEELLRPPVES